MAKLTKEALLDKESFSGRELAELSLGQVSALLAAGRVTSRSLTENMLERAGANESNAYITVNQEALAQADASDKRRALGQELGPLDGVPMALKDNICVQGLKTTCASRMLENFIPPYSATVARRLSDAGAVLLGKLNMDEFAMGSTSENSIFGPVKNPRNPKLVPGGSSGGSAAAVAERSAYFTLGTDTGGSVRQPAALCGVVGLKPTYGRISRYGVVAFASSLDQIGTLASDVEGAALSLQAIAGKDPLDGSSLAAPAEDYLSFLKGAQGAKGLKIGVPEEYMGPGIQEEVRRAVLSLSEKLKAAGATVEACSLPRLDYALSAYYVISSAEACSNLGRYDGVKYGYRAPSYDGLEDMIRTSRSQGFGDEVKRRILLGTYTLSAGYFDAYYRRAQQARTLIMEDFRQAFEKYDVLLTPTSPVTAWPIGTRHTDPSEVYAMDICTVSVNVAGLPAISLPCGQDSRRMPIGAQLIGRPLSEGILLKAAQAAEELAGEEARAK
ncbi:MAG: Asp-tRNA(Asn)/Glu-tRNA(Gln) amidotransferase subunit GatA [Peptococcaceae bacterium]|nr:Asp-tRNA(Asn)/Glu-tRNA(Gln) amidotransferase subunit GatA [Peptococcaceae bacterium]